MRLHHFHVHYRDADSGRVCLFDLYVATKAVALECCRNENPGCQIVDVVRVAE